MAAFFEKSYKNTRTIHATAFTVACMVFYVWYPLNRPRCRSCRPGEGSLPPPKNGTLPCETLSREYEKAWGNSRVSSSSLRKSCMAVMHNGSGRHAQSHAECVHNSAGTHAQRPAVSMRFPGGVRNARSIVTQNIFVRQGLGREPQQAEKTHPIRISGTGDFSCLWEQRHCLHRYKTRPNIIKYSNDILTESAFGTKI